MNFDIDSIEGLSLPQFIWTINGTPSNKDSSNHAELCFNEAGKFTVCAEIYYGKSTSGDYCDYRSKCVQVTVNDPPQIVLAPLTLCQAQLPYEWNCQLITAAGIYQCPFINGCCKGDSILEIIIKENYSPDTVRVTRSKGDYYVEPIYNDTIRECLEKYILYPNVKTASGCDSSYFLQVSYPELELARWDLNCGQKDVDIYPILTPETWNCSSLSNMVLNIKYNWYEKNTPNISLGTDNYYNASIKGEYCVDIELESKLGSQVTKLNNTFCEDINESEYLKYQYTLDGPSHVSKNSVSRYSFTVSPNKSIQSYNWYLEGGTIITPNYSDSASIEILWDNLDTIGRVCLGLVTDCPPKNGFCLEIKLDNPTTTYSPNKNDSIVIVPNPNNGEFYIKWDSKMAIEKLEIFNNQGKKILQKATPLFNQYHFKDFTLPKGVYFIKMSSEDKTIIKKCLIL